MAITHRFGQAIIALPRHVKRLLLVSFDFLVLTGVLWASFSLRLDKWSLPTTFDEILVIVSGPLVAIPVFIRMGLYRAVVRYLPERALWTIVRAVTLAVVLWVLAAFLSQMAFRFTLPRSVPIIYWALTCIIMVGSRFAAKWVFWPYKAITTFNRPTVAIYGAGESGAQLAAALGGSHSVICFIDDNKALYRREVAGLRVHPPEHLSTLVRDFGIKQVILCMPGLSPARRKAIVADLGQHHVEVRFVPVMNDLVSGKYLVSQVRDIEIDDLLGRSSVPPSIELIETMVTGRTIMVTGAGGSIGSELCRKIAEWRPQRLVLFEANEFALYKLERELAAASDAVTVPVLGSVTDERLVSSTIKKFAIQVVFHAAAHKHVPLVEANALEGIRNNVLGTQTVAESAYRNGVKHFVLISTDKAVRPTNVMGATKRWAELIVQQKAQLALASATGQRFSSVRFGNVLGSNGSVVPLFKEQIAHGGPVTVTDLNMTRYFMSIKEAAELIVQAGALSQGGDVFLLDMGEPVRISELAENMVRLAGLTVRSADNPDGDIEIISIGKRPGEKMYEELFYDHSQASVTQHPKIMRAANATLQELQEAMGVLQDALEASDEAAARRILFEIVSKSDSGASIPA